MKTEWKNAHLALQSIKDKQMSRANRHRDNSNFQVGDYVMAWMFPVNRKQLNQEGPLSIAGLAHFASERLRPTTRFALNFLSKLRLVWEEFPMLLSSNHTTNAILETRFEQYDILVTIAP